MSVTFSVGIALDDLDQPLPNAPPEILSYEVIGDKQSLMRLSRRSDGKLRLDRLNQKHRSFRDVLNSIYNQRYYHSLNLSL